MILVDAGPLVALLNASDRHHASCVELTKKMHEPFFTVWPVMTEAAYLLAFSRQAQDALFDMLERGAIRLLRLELDDVARIRELLRKYSDLPMDFADAALVRVAEREQIRTVFTIDRRDFSVYRPRRLGRFTIVP
jgi:predicted nucleic acid-binding protein